MEVKRNSGEFALKGAVKLLLFMMLLSAALTIYHVYHAIGAVREDVNEAVLAVASSNVAEFYGGAREADGYARHPAEGAFAASVSSEDVLDKLRASTGAEETSDETLMKEGSFTIRDLHTSFINFDGTDLNFTTTLTVEVPLMAGGLALSSIQKNLEVNSSYAPRF